MSHSSGSSSARSDNHTGLPKIAPRASSSGSGSKRRLIASPRSEHLHDPEAQNAIRRRIVEGLPRSKRPYDPNRIELVLPADFMSTSPPLTGGATHGSAHGSPPVMLNIPSANSSSQYPQDTSEMDPFPGTIVPISPITPLGAGRIDPFANYPIKMNRGEQWLIDQGRSENDGPRYDQRLSDIPPIPRECVFECFASALGEENLDNAVTVAHHSLAIRSVNQKLSDPVLKASDDVLLGILSFRCYNLVKGDFDAAAVHLEGLNNVVELRGGYSGAGIAPVLVSLIYGVEMTRICRQDTKPLFPVPETFDITQEQKFGSPSTTLPYLTTSTPAGLWNDIFPVGHPIIDTFENLNSVIQLAASKATQDKSWKVVNFVIRRLYPILHKLMSLKIEDAIINDYWAIVQEASRPAIFFFLGELRRQCGALGVSTTLFLSKFKTHMMDFGATIDWQLCNPPLLWMLFFGMLESWGLPEQDWYLETIVCVAKAMELGSWDAIVQEVKRLLWVEDIHNVKAAVVGQYFMAKLS